MIIRNFEYLLALARERHFSRAAAACHVSQPTLSGGIKQLETDMGVRIVKRGRAFEGLTVEGERVLAWAQQMMDDCLRLKQELRSFRDAAMQGPFRIGVLPVTVPLASLLTVPLSIEAPSLELSLVTASAPELINLLRSGEIDVALTYLEDPPVEGMTIHLLYCEGIYQFSLSQDQGSAEPNGFDAVIQQPLCLLRDGLPSNLIDKFAGAPKLMWTDAPSIIAAHVQSGLRSTILPQSMARLFTASVDLKVIPMGGDGITQVNVGFMIRKGEPTSAALQAFMELAHSTAVVQSIREMLAAHKPFLRKKSTKQPV